MDTVNLLSDPLGFEVFEDLSIGVCRRHDAVCRAPLFPVVICSLVIANLDAVPSPRVDASGQLTRGKDADDVDGLHGFIL